MNFGSSSSSPDRLKSVAMRLLSFLSDIERAIITHPPAFDGGGWVTARSVNFQQGVARLTLHARNGGERAPASGAIFLQAFALADGSVCIKASLTWKESDAFPAIAVYSTPTVNWNAEAGRVASAWLEGPPAAEAAAVLPGQSRDALAARAS
jgi:hypothetical protein